MLPADVAHQIAVLGVDVYATVYLEDEGSAENNPIADRSAGVLPTSRPDWWSRYTLTWAATGLMLGALLSVTKEFVSRGSACRALPFSPSVAACACTR